MEQTIYYCITISTQSVQALQVYTCLPHLLLLVVKFFFTKIFSIRTTEQVSQLQKKEKG